MTTNVPAAVEPAATTPAPALAPAPPRRRSLGRRLLFALLFLILLVGGAEIILRALGVGRPVSGFIRASIGGEQRLRPNPWVGRRYFPPGMERAIGGYDFPAHKPAGTVRLFVLGESAARGFPIEQHSFATILGAMLRTADPDTRYELINTAMTAINSHVVAEIGREIAGYEPDVLVIYCGNNEFVGPWGPGTTLRDFTGSLALIRLDLALKRSYAVQLLARLFAGAPEPKAWGGMEMFVERRIAPDDPRLPTVAAHLRANLRSAIDAARARGARVLLCTVAVNLRDCPPFASSHPAAFSGAPEAEWRAAFQRGAALQESGQHTDALKAYDEAAALQPDHAELQFRRGECLLATGAVAAARAAFAAARDADALRFRTTGPLNAAIRDLAAEYSAPDVTLVDVEERFAAASPDGIPGRAHFYEHVHLNFDGNYAIAAALFEQLRDALPRLADKTQIDAAEARRLTAFTGFDEFLGVSRLVGVMRDPPFPGRYGADAEFAAMRTRLEELLEWTQPEKVPEVTAAYRAAADRWPDDPARHRMLAGLLQLQRDFPAADAHFRRAIELTTETRETRIAYARMLHEQGRLEEAATQYKAVLAEEPDAGNALAGMGMLYRDKGRPRDAIDYFKRSIRYLPDAVVPRVELAKLQIADGRLKQAAESLETAWRLDPKNLVVCDIFQNVLIRERRYGYAAQVLRTGLQHHPQNPGLLNNLAWLLATCPEPGIRNGRDALQFAVKAADLTQQEPRTLDTLAAACAEAGAWDQALQAITAALQKTDPQQQPELYRELTERRSLYAARKPYRQQP